MKQLIADITKCGRKKAYSKVEFNFGQQVRTLLVPHSGGRGRYGWTMLLLGDMGYEVKVSVLCMVTVMETTGQHRLLLPLLSVFQNYLARLYC